MFSNVYIHFENFGQKYWKCAYFINCTSTSSQIIDSSNEIEEQKRLEKGLGNSLFTKTKIYKFQMRNHEDFGPIVKSLCLVMISTLTHFNTLEKSGQIVMQQIQPRFFSKNVTFEGPLQGNFLWNNLSEILEGSSIKLWSHITKPQVMSVLTFTELSALN